MKGNKPTKKPKKIIKDSVIPQNYKQSGFSFFINLA